MAAGSTSAPALGRRFVDALAARDRERLAAVLHPQIDFRGLTPSRFWEAALSERDGRIGWMRVVCSGFRSPVHHRART